MIGAVSGRGQSERDAMRDITRAISIARRRLLAGRVLMFAGKALVIALPAILALLLVDRLFGFALPVAVYGAPIALATVAGVALAVWRAPKAIDVCIEIDRRLHLKDRIGSAHAIANSPAVAMPAFAPLVLADAQELARKLDLRHAIPIRFGSQWSWTVVFAVALALVAWLVPMRQPTPGNGPNAPAMLPAEVAAATEALDKATDDIRQTLDRKDDEQRAAEAPAALDEKMDALDAIAKQLTNHDPTNPEVARARSEASASMSELADEMTARSERELNSLDELARRFDGMDTPGGPAELDPKLREFIDAMSRGEYDDAADALEDAANAAKSLDPEARRDAAEQFRQLSEQIAKLAEQQQAESTKTSEADGADEQDQSSESAAADETKQREQDLRQALEDLGKSPEEIDRMLEPAPREKSSSDESSASSPDQSKQNEAQDSETANDNKQSPENLARELREAGADDELAEEMARDIENVRKQREASKQADEQAKELSDAVRRTAESIDSSDSAQDQPKQNKQNESEPTATKPGENAQAPKQNPKSTDEQQQTAGNGREGQPTQQPGEQPGAQPDPTKPVEPGQPTAPNETPTTKPGEKPTETPNAEPTSENSEKPAPGTHPAPGEPQPTSGEPEPTPGESPTETTPPAGGEPIPGEPAPTPGTKPGPGTAPTPNGTQTGTPPQDEPGAAPNGDAPPPDGPTTLRDLERLRDLARRNKQFADKLKERAHEVGDTLTPEEKRNIERWEKAQRREDAPDSPGPLPPGTEPGADRLVDPVPFEHDSEDVNLTQGDINDGNKVGEFKGNDLPVNDPANRANAARLNSAAQQKAQRAIEQGEVPARYHRFIQRYFKSLGEKTSASGAQNAEGKK